MAQINDLLVLGNSNLLGSMSTLGNASINGTLTVGSNTKLNGSLDIKGPLTCDGKSISTDDLVKPMIVFINYSSNGTVRRNYSMNEMYEAYWEDVLIVCEYTSQDGTLHTACLVNKFDEDDNGNFSFTFVGHTDNQQDVVIVLHSDGTVTETITNSGTVTGIKLGTSNYIVTPNSSGTVTLSPTATTSYPGLLNAKETLSVAPTSDYYAAPVMNGSPYIAIPKLRSGASGATAHAAATNPYITLSSIRGASGQVQLYGSAGITIASDAAGKITFSPTYGTSTAALGTSSAGTANSFSRSDHVHALPTLSDFDITAQAQEINMLNGVEWVAAPVPSTTILDGTVNAVFGTQATLSSSGTVVQGENYVVTWENVDYICTVFNFDGGAGLGDATIIEPNSSYRGSNPNAPFLISGLTSTAVSMIALRTTPVAGTPVKIRKLAPTAVPEAYMPIASSSTLGGVKIGNNINVSGGTISLSKANVTNALGYTPPTKPSATTANAIARYNNTTGDLKNSGILIEDVTNTRDTTKKAHVLSIPAEGGKKMVYGYCTDQIDGTSFIGGVFDASATSFPYSAGLAIGGSSGNLLWKAKRVLTTDDGLDAGNVNRHIYLTGAKASSSTGNTSQIVFGTSADEHVALSSNTAMLVINPNTTSSANQILLKLATYSTFPKGIKVTTESGLTPSESLLRNSKLVSTATNPSMNGEICWQYE